MLRRLLLLGFSALLCLGCDDVRRPSGGNQPRRDAGQQEDGATTADAGFAGDGAAGPDAGVGGDDGAAGPDVPVSFDASPGRDATSFPDATGFPDAIGFPDAEGPDAGFVLPDAGPMGATIGQIRSGAIGFGALVQINDVVVTAFHDEAARNDTAWVQDPRAGVSNAGMKVFIRGVHSATRNARVDITGTVVDYFGETEINDATVVLRGGTGVITPVPLTSAQAADESYEGMLVRLVDVSTINPSYSCSLDDARCMDLRLWEVNGSGGILVYNFVYEDFDWDSRSASTGITGVMSWRYNRRRIMPRNGADFSP